MISETVRLHPSVPKDGKFALKDDVWPDGTPIKAGRFVPVLYEYTDSHVHTFMDNSIA